MALIHPPLLELKNQALLTSVTTQLVPGWIDLYRHAEARGPFKKGEKCKKGIVFRATPLDGILIDGVQRDSYTRRQSWANPYVGPRTLTLYLARQRRWNRYGTLIFRPYFAGYLAATFVNRDRYNGPWNAMSLERTTVASGTLNRKLCKQEKVRGKNGMTKRLFHYCYAAWESGR